MILMVADAVNVLAAEFFRVFAVGRCKGALEACLVYRSNNGDALSLEFFDAVCLNFIDPFAHHRCAMPGRFEHGFFVRVGEPVKHVR